MRRPPGPPPSGLRSLYPPEEYDQARPLYPRELFAPLRPGLGRALPRPLTVADLGCGTGLAWLSFHSAEPQLPTNLILVEPNPVLLESAARKALAASPLSVRTIATSAERIAADSESVDLALVGSAWHWFQPNAVDEVARLIKPGGQLFVFEYQFPKLDPDPAGLNEWVRRQFNEVWRFEEQAPRGTLWEKTSAVRARPELSLTRSISREQSQPHPPEFFCELIFTQARYLHFVQSLENQKALDVRNEVFRQVQDRWTSTEQADFLYRFEGYLFQKRWV